MANRRLPNWGYKGKPPKTKGTKETPTEVFAGPHTHEESYMLKVANQFEYPQENLIQYLDKQFYTSGSTWTDQSGSGNNATFVGSISQSTTYGGSIGTFYYAFQQTSNWLNLTSVLNDISSASAWTMCWVGYVDLLNGTQSNHGLSIANASDNNLHIVRGTDPNGTKSGYFSTYYNGTANTSVPHKYQFCAYTHNGTNTKLYTSNDGTTHTTGGAQKDIRQGTGFVLNQEQDSSLGGFDANQCSQWYISAWMVYDEVISSQDISDLQGYFAGIYPIET